MFESIINIFKKNKKQDLLKSSSKNTAKERLHLVLMQDRANVSADFLDLMRKEIIEVIKKYIDIDEKAIDVRLTTETNEDGSKGAPALYANIPIINIKDETRSKSKTNQVFEIIEEKTNKEDSSLSNNKENEEEKTGEELDNTGSCENEKNIEEAKNKPNKDKKEDVEENDIDEDTENKNEKDIEENNDEE